MTARDTQGMGPEPSSAAAPKGEAGPAAPPEGDGRPSAPVLSLEAGKAQRRRETEKARPLRNEAPEAEAKAPLGRPRKDRAEEPPRAAPASEAVPGAGPGTDAASAAPRLRGVQPDGTPDKAPIPEAPAVVAPASPPARRPAPSPAPAAAPARPPAPSRAPSRAPAAAAQPRKRHWFVLASFVALVILPTALTAWYAWTRAAPRFVSSAAFSVRTEDQGSAMSLLGGVAALAGASSSSDTDVLYEFIGSQQIVELIDARLDLRALWSKGDPARDPVFAYHAPGTIEDLHAYWNRMVAVYSDSGTGLLSIEAQAFTPEDAHAVTEAIEAESTALVNRLSAIAQEDGTRYAKEELATAVERLKVARAALTRFRNETQMVDPVTAVASQMGLLSSLEAQLAQTLIDLDLLRQTAPDSDPRIAQAQARVGVIEARMASERAKLGLGPAGPMGASAEAPGEGQAEVPDGEAFADLVGQFESLTVDQEFAATAYVAALAAYDAALAEARRQSRYLAAHIQPTMAQRAAHPNRVTLTALTFVFALLAWTILALGGYALRDRR